MSDSLCRSVVQPIARRLTAAGSGIGSSITYLSRLMTTSTTTPYYSGTTNIVDVASTGDYREIQPGRCLDFDETTQSINLIDQNINIPFVDGTYSVWFYADVGSVEKFIDQNTGGRIGFGTVAGVTTLGMYCTIGGSTSKADAYVPLKWHHCVWVLENQTRALYVNGELLQTFAAGYPTTFTGGRIGAIYNDTGNHFDGKLFDLRFYTRALTAAEITALYRQGLQPDAVVAGQPDATNLVGRWLLDDNSQTTSYDSSGNGNHGTIVGYASGMLYEGDDVPYSQQNLVGYSEGTSSTFVPRDESDPGNDVLGNPLDYTGTAPKYATPVDAPCLTWDGSTQLLPVAGLSGSETVVRSGGTSTPSISAGQIDFTAGTCWDLLLSNGMYFPFSEGDGNTVYDVVNGNSYTITGYASTMWDNKQDLFFYSFENGCRVDSGVAIPALADGSAAADGNPLTGLPGLLNSDTYDLNLLPEPDAPYQRSAIPGATFDGVGDGVAVPTIFWDVNEDWEISTECILPDTSDMGIVGCIRTAPEFGLSLVFFSGNYIVRLKLGGYTNGVNLFSPTVNMFTPPEWASIHCLYVAATGQVVMTVNGVEYSGTVSAPTNNPRTEYQRQIAVGGRLLTNALYQGTIRYVNVRVGQNKFEYDFRENNGLIIPDRSGNGNDGTLIVNSSLSQIFAPTALETAYTLGDGRTRPHYVTVDSPNEKEFRTEII
jgi:hypothetical protein